MSTGLVVDIVWNQLKSSSIKTREGEIRLIKYWRLWIGQVVMFLSGKWGRVCDTYNLYNETDAQVVCRQLGYNPYGNCYKTILFLKNYLAGMKEML